MDNDLKRILELAGIKEANNHLPYGSKNDTTIKRKNGQTLMINPDGEDEWVDSQYEEDAIDYGYYYSTDADAERYEQNRMDKARSQAASMFEDDEPQQNEKKEDLAKKVAIIVAQLVEMYPAEDSNADITRQGDEYLDDEENGVSFIANVGIPVVNTTSITRHQATYYEPEDIDDHEEEVIVDKEMVIYAEVGGIMVLMNGDGDDYGSISSEASTEEVVKQFSKYIEDTKLGAEGTSEYFPSYKAARAARYDGP